MTLPLVLIVDDNPENLTVIGELLQPGHVVRAANAGARALKLAAMSPRPDLVLLDVMMPEMDGYEVLARLRQQPGNEETPVIFLTALNSSADEERGLMLGAADYITKPIRPSVLLARVRTQLELKRARDRLRAVDAGHDATPASQTQLIRQAGLRAMARLAEARDPMAGDHLERTQAVVAVLARQLHHKGLLPPGLDTAALARLIESVSLHDIGMAVVPDRVLQKPGPLDADEWAVLKTHAVAGADALGWAERGQGQPAGVLDFARQVARHHHERWDGHGYPDGLAGEAIPLAARLVAVADAFVALVSPRAYRPAGSIERAFRAVVQESGGQFDPQVVDAFIECFDELRVIGGAAASPAMPAAATLPAGGAVAGAGLGDGTA